MAKKRRKLLSEAELAATAAATNARHPGKQPAANEHGDQPAAAANNKVAHIVRVQTRVRFQRRGPASPIGFGEPESTRGESDLLWIRESEFTEESDLLWTRESESKEEPDLLWTGEPESN
jgi:hypothetical protein